MAQQAISECCIDKKAHYRGDSCLIWGAIATESRTNQEDQDHLVSYIEFIGDDILLKSIVELWIGR